MKSGLMNQNSSVEDEGRDRLSELPDEVLVHILSLMPTLDAVRTVLLRRFGNLWTLVHSLFINDLPYRDDKREISPASMSLFSEFVWNVLIRHRRPTINKFHLELREGIPEIEDWIGFAIRKEARSLTLSIDVFSHSCATLPCCVLNSQSLVSLQIRGCNIEHQGRVHMGSLRKLELVYGSVKEELFKEVISGCPVLEELEICCNNASSCIASTTIKRLKFGGWARCVIDCPNLKTLHIYASVTDVEANQVSSVSEADIDLFGMPSEESGHQFLSFLKKFGNAEVLKLSDDSIQHFTYCSMKELVFPPNRWKRFSVKALLDDARILGVCRFVRNLPFLEELSIFAEPEDEVEPIMGAISDPNLLIQELSSPCVMLQLKTIIMHGCGKPYQGQLQLAEFLLKSAVNLDKLLFVSDLDRQLAPAEELDFVTQLSSFQRASANARVVFA